LGFPLRGKDGESVTVIAKCSAIFFLWRIIVRIRMIPAILGLLMVATFAWAEEQVQDGSGKVVEIRQEYGATTYAYDAGRNLIYTATPGGVGGVVDYRDKYGVYIGTQGPGLPWNGSHIRLPYRDYW
jgi:hypothetical protein